jgi:hypothetical protein
MTVTVCFLTRNHGDCLGRALASVAPHFSDVLIADTGSTDGTVSAAAEWASRIIQVPWHNDFSKACNATLEQIETPWVLWLNADEELTIPAVESIRRAIQEPKLFAARLQVRQLLKPAHPELSTLVWESRLFRRDPAVRYVSRVHPRFAPPLEELARNRDQSIAMLPGFIDRHAYRNVLSLDKLKWVVQLLEAEQADNPGQLAIDIELGRNLLMLGEPRGHELLGECASRVLERQHSPIPPDPMVGQLLEYILNVSPELSKSTLSKEQARELGMRWFPITPPVLWAIAAERFSSQDFASAIEPLRRLVELGQSGQYDPAGGFDPEIIGAASLLNLGMCYYQLENWLGAKTCFAALLQHHTMGERAQRLYSHCEFQARGS